MKTQKLIIGICLTFFTINYSYSQTITLSIEGTLTVNGNPFNVSGTGNYNPFTGAYLLQNVAPVVGPLSNRDRFIVTMIARSALAFMNENGGLSLLEQSLSGIQLTLSGERKVEPASSISASVQITSGVGSATITYNASITTLPDRGIEPDGEAVIRLGINPLSQTFVGGARVNYDLNDPDPDALGTADFWNFNGSYTGPAPSQAINSIGHVDKCGGNPAAGLAQGTTIYFPSSTVVLPSVLTFTGTATQDGIFNQYLGIANQTGGGLSLFCQSVQITNGMTANQVAALVEQTLNNAPSLPNVIAVQGGDGVSITTSNPLSNHVAISMTTNGSTIANPNDIPASLVFNHATTQNFPDWKINPTEYSGVRTQFGALGHPSLRGWLTPFRIEVFTTNPSTGFAASGGDFRIHLNWEDALPGGIIPGTTTSFSDMAIITTAGETAVDISKNLSNAVKGLVTPWNDVPRTQRLGSVLFFDAGIEFPHSVSISSSDQGVGFASAAADLSQANCGNPAIPTLSEWGLILLGILLLFICSRAIYIYYNKRQPAL